MILPRQAGYEITYRSSTRFIKGPQPQVRARNVILSGGVMGTLNLLLRLRDVDPLPARSVPPPR